MSHWVGQILSDLRRLGRIENPTDSRATLVVPSPAESAAAHECPPTGLAFGKESGEVGGEAPETRTWADLEFS